MNTTPSLDIAGLEKVYDNLAEAIDQAGSDKSELFLVKLALLNAKALVSPAVFEANIADALKDL
jgi:sulfur relay (sulfurtransferase) complex TusBCD TusD component (DsrE family)